MITKFFRTSSLWQLEEAGLLAKLQAAVPQIQGVRIERCFHVDSSRDLTPDEASQLAWILRETFELEQFGITPRLLGGIGDVLFEVGPRLNIVTPFSTNAVSICRACNLPVTRIEVSRRVFITSRPPLTGGDAGKVVALIHDKMTEQPYDKPVVSFETGVVPEPVYEIPLVQESKEAVRREAAKMGLPIADDEVLLDYFCAYFIRIGRNPADVELFQFGQLNSDHCRHHHFNGKFVIDGVEMPKSQFAMIRATTEANPGNVKSAYSDNAAAFAPREARLFMPSDPMRPSAFIIVLKRQCLILKVETHNHPTFVCADPGAGTGLGGLLRDIMGPGRSGVPKACLACYNVGVLLIPGYPLPWERVLAPFPERFESPLDIIIHASNGASRYGNEFGQPLVLGSFRSFEQMVGEVHYGYRKPVMVAGDWGTADEEHVNKDEVQAGDLVIQLGGDGYPIGVGGGSASSKAAGSQSAGLDFASVQRSNAEMENRVNEVTRAFSELGPKNPVVTLTDEGAGGHCVALAELVNPKGARYELRKLPCGDRTMTVVVVWCNESQERIVVVIRSEGLPLVKELCARNRCPMAVVGVVTGDGRIVVVDSEAGADAPREQKEPVDLSMDFLLASLPKKTINCSRVELKLPKLELPADLTIRGALERVLRMPDVASKHFLTKKVDRSVGGLVAQQQTVGPLQLTMADCAVTATGHFDTSGEATSIGEQPVVGLVSSAAGSRMSLAESLTNMAGVAVESFGSINMSATWQWPCGEPGEDARLHDAVKGATDDLCKMLGLRIPVGKDSTSMVAKLDGNHRVRSPGTVQFVATAPCPDVTKKATPDIKEPGVTSLMLLSPFGSKCRMGGSALARAFEQLGDTAPDVDNPEQFKAMVEAVQELVRKGLVLACHDVSDGGLITCLLEMAFAGNCGFEVFLDRSFGVMDCLHRLFTQELGLVLEFRTGDLDEICGVLKKFGMLDVFNVIGSTKVAKTVIVNDMQLQEVFSGSMEELRDTWQETSFKLDELQANPVCVMAERKAVFSRTGMKFDLKFVPEATNPELLDAAVKPKVAILREEGTNGHREMAAAFHAAGFEPWDVTMTDLICGRVKLGMFRGIVFCGGFSFADVMDSGKGWAAVIKFNLSLRGQFEAFFADKTKFVLGVCNGCQLMALLGCVPWSGIDGRSQPRFVRNQSGIFESRFVSVRVRPSQSIFLKGMLDSVLGIWVAHGEGRLIWPDDSIREQSLLGGLAPLVYANDGGGITEDYPFNPNGSVYGVAALCSPDGRHLAMMPHPERLFQHWQWPWWPREWSELQASPWLRMFQNARDWCLATA